MNNDLGQWIEKESDRRNVAIHFTFLSWQYLPIIHRFFFKCRKINDYVCYLITFEYREC